MIQHLTPSDFKTMPWANGKGSTIEMLKTEENGALKWRLSRASVVENGDFSIFPNVARNLTVITGPGFDLIGSGQHLPARALQPVAFSGETPIRAENVTTASDDFNVMTAANLPRPEVTVINGAAHLPGGDQLAIYALAPTKTNAATLATGDLYLTDQPLRLDGHFIAVRLFG
jgi:environmental stress-induced protein Ves